MVAWSVCLHVIRKAVAETTKTAEAAVPKPSEDRRVPWVE